MKTKFIIIPIIFLLSVCSLSAQPWTVSSNNYEFSMNIIGAVSINDNVLNQQNSFIGAFVNNNCVGVTSPVEYNSSYNLFYLTIYSNQSSGEVVTFKYVDESEIETSISNEVMFASDSYIGTAENPFLWMDVANYNSTDIFDYSFPEQTTDAVINCESKTVSISIGANADINLLIADFTLAPGAKAYVNDIEQESGLSENNFSSVVTYEIIGADNTTVNWEVTVTKDNSEVSDELLNDINIFPNPVQTTLNIENNIFDEIEILNMEGKCVLENNLQDVKKVKIDVSQLSGGLYFVKLSNNSQTIIKKIVIE